MKKAAIAITVAIISVFLCSCGGEKMASSMIVETEKDFSSIITSSEISSSDAASLESSSSKVVSDVSLKAESLISPTSSTSSTMAEDVIKNVDPANAAGVGVYHFYPGWTNSYGDSDEKRLEEFRDVIEAGYFNSVMTGTSYILNDEFWNICLKNNVQVWISFWDIFNSSKMSFDDHYAKLFTVLENLKKYPDRWNQFVGFHWEEPMWRSETNADFLLETGNLYKKYGKRIFPVFATGEFSEVEGNENNIKMTAADMRKVHPDALKYVTDIGFDSYSVDVRDGTGNGDYISRVKKILPNVYDGKSCYEEYTKLLLRLAGHDVNVWFFPCAFRDYLWSGNFADESYCLAHLNFFRELLLKQKFKGGMYLYTYKTFSNNPGLEQRLIVKTGERYKLFPDKPEEKWEYYSFRLKEITEEFKKMTVKQVYGV